MPLLTLIVEDSEADAKMVLHELRRGGYTLEYERVDNAADMRAALLDRQWDIVISDYTMPDFDGLSALLILKESGLDLPFIIVSGSVGESLAVEAMRAGAHDYLMKDNLARFVPAVARELREAQIRRERRQAEEALHHAYTDLEARVQERTAELARANVLLQNAVKMRDEFLSVAAHELKTPITSLKGYTELFMRRIDKKGTIEMAEIRQSFVTIKQQADRMAQLIAQLMDTSRISSDRLTMELAPTDIVRLVNDAIVTAHFYSPDFEIEPIMHDPVIVLADVLRMEQVFSNLLNNAVKYSPNNELISVDFSIVGLTTVCIAVIDHGIGVPMEHRPHIFERFYQAHGNGYLGGMGLGLYISQQIVKFHGGRIELETSPDGGTRFAVYLPIMSVPPDSLPQNETLSENPAT